MHLKRQYTPDEIWEEYGNWIEYYAYKVKAYTKCELDDARQEMFIQALQHNGHMTTAYKDCLRVFGKHCERWNEWTSRGKPECNLELDHANDLEVCATYDDADMEQLEWLENIMSETEAEVIIMISRGWSQTEIAEKLEISKGRVSQIVCSAKGKLIKDINR